MERTLALITMPVAAVAAGIVILFGMAIQIAWCGQIVVPTADMLRDGLTVFFMFVAVLGCGFGHALGVRRVRGAASNERKARENDNRRNKSIYAGFHLGFGPRPTH